MKRVAILGTQGVPGRYGGFETLVENLLGDNCSSEVEYTVFCSGKNYKERKSTYKGANLEYINGFYANGIESVPYDILSMIKTIGRFDTVLILGVSGCIFLPIYRLLYRKKLIVNIDGLEHRRGKWGKFTRNFLKLSETMAVKFADVVIADNKAIQEYVTENYHKPSTLIAYGYDHVKRNLTDKMQQQMLRKYEIEPNSYAISICRIEPENNVQLICDTFAATGKSLVFIGNWNHNDYSRNLKKKYECNSNIRIVTSLYDLDELYALRNNCSCYIHGHSAGGTNPSLVEAMYFGKPILAFDVVYNRETTENAAYYFKDCEQLTNLYEQLDKDGTVMRCIAERRYTWKRISEQYEEIL